MAAAALHRMGRADEIARRLARHGTPDLLIRMLDQGLNTPPTTCSEEHPRMCLALPARIVEIHDDDTATICLGGVRKVVSLAQVADVRIDEFVIVHAGYAIAKLDPVKAERTLAMLLGQSADRPAK